MNKRIYELYGSFLDNVGRAEEMGVTVQEFWDTFYKPYVIEEMNKSK